MLSRVAAVRASAPAASAAWTAPASASVGSVRTLNVSVERYPRLPGPVEMIPLDKEDMASGLHTHVEHTEAGDETFLYNWCDRIVWTWAELRTEGTGDGDGSVAMVNEISQGTDKKMEVSGELVYNPIVQDRNKDGSFRVLSKAKPWNYGMIPQTYENPDIKHADSQYGGDGDALDIIEIGGSPFTLGQVAQVRVLGVLGLIDEGETDWKIIAVNEKAGSNYKDISSVEASKLEAIREYYRTYKVPEGKGENSYLFNGEAKNAQYALDLIAEHKKQFEQLQAYQWEMDHAEFRQQFYDDMRFEFNDKHSMNTKPFGPGSEFWPKDGAVAH